MQTENDQMEKALDDLNDETSCTLNSWRKNEPSPSMMGHIFCKGAPSEGESASFISLESGSVLPSQSQASSKFWRSNNDNGHGNSSINRQPLQATRVNNNQNCDHNNHELTPTSGRGAGGCFSDAVASLMPSMVTNRTSRAKICGCIGDGACGGCWAVRSNFLPPLPSPEKADSNPVIESLGLTPKTKNRPNKYDVSSNNMVMNEQTGVSIPTPAPMKRKKYTPVFTPVRESISRPDSSHSLKEASQSTDQSAFLPDDYKENKENAGVYSEADLQARIEEALENQRAELETKFASESEDSAVKDLDMKMQQQLEEQSRQWNREMQERIQATKNHYKNKQSALKAHVAALEQQCQELEAHQLEDRLEHERQMEMLQQEMANAQEASDTERAQLLEKMAKQSEKLSQFDEDRITPGFVRVLQNKLEHLQVENKELASREAKLKEQMAELDATVTENEERRLIGQENLAALRQHFENAELDKSKVDNEIEMLRNELASRDEKIDSLEQMLDEKSSPQKRLSKSVLAEKAGELKKMKDGLRGYIDCLVAQVENAQQDDNRGEYIKTTDSMKPFDEADTVDSLLEAFGQQVDKLLELLEETRRRGKETTKLANDHQISNNNSDSSGDSLAVASEALKKLLQDVELMKSHLATAADSGEHFSAAKEQDDRDRVDAPKLDELAQTIGSHIQLLQQSNSVVVQDHDRANCELLGLETSAKHYKHGSSIETTGLREQLEAKRMALAKKEKQHIDAMRTVQKLREQLREIQQDAAKNEEALKVHGEIQEMGTEHAENTKEFQSQIDELNAQLSSKLRDQSAVEPLLKKQNERMQQELIDLRQHVKDLEQSLREKESRLDSLVDDMTKARKEKFSVTETIDALIVHISKTEAQHDLHDDFHSVCSSTSFKSAMSADITPTALEAKLAKVEQHLLHVWDDFTRKKVAELTSQKYLLSEMQNKIASHKEESAQTIQKLHTRIKELEGELEQEQAKVVKSATEIECLKEEISQSHIVKAEAEKNREQSLNRIQVLEGELEQEQAKAVSSASEIDCLKKEISQSQIVKAETDKKQQQILNRIQEVQDKLELEEAKAITSASEVERLKKEISQSQVDKRETEIKHQAALESMSQQVKSLKASSAELEKCRPALEKSRIECATLKEQMEKLITESASLRERARDLEKLVEMKSGNLEKELLEKTAELEAKSSATIQRCEEQVRQVKEAHTKEIDDLLQQLDLVEAEQYELCEKKERQVREKDAIVAALGAQLAESQNRIVSLEKSLAEHSRTLEQAQDDLFRVNADGEALKCELEKIREKHASVVESERVKREAAIEQVRDETIAEAEAQFEAANTLYRNVVQECKNEKVKVQQLESDLQFAKQEIENDKKKHVSDIASLQSDIAELKASKYAFIECNLLAVFGLSWFLVLPMVSNSAFFLFRHCNAGLAKADATAARSVKDSLNDLERLKENEKHLQSRLAQAELSNKTIQKLLATVVGEKEELKAENDEIRAMAEEAMSLAETTHST